MLVELSTGPQEGVQGLKVELVWENLSGRDHVSPGGALTPIQGAGTTFHSTETIRSVACTWMMHSIRYS